MITAKLNKTPNPEVLFRNSERYEGNGNFRDAFKCLLVAAELGHVGSQINLGNFYAWGKGTRRNPEKAAYWYKKAYTSGDSDGAHNLAIDRRNEGNIRSAVVWFKKAVAMNNGDSLIELAKIYKARRGGQKSASELLKRALQLGRENISDAERKEAKCLLEEMAKILK
jgi:uncharacterized protein